MILAMRDCFGSVANSRNDSIDTRPAGHGLKAMALCRFPAVSRSLMAAGMALLVLAGCAALPETADDQVAARAAFAERSVTLVAVTEWRLAGRLTLELPAETWTGQVGWRSDATGQVIDFSGPMGRGGGRLLLGGHQALLVTRDGERHTASDPDALIALITGRAIPVSGLAYWVRGMARPGAGFDLRADLDGQPARLIQDGWEIFYGAFEDTGATEMPASLELRREDMRLRLLIQRWQLGPAPVS